MRPGGAAARPARPRARSRERLRPRLAGRRDRQRARTARPPRRLPRRCSAPATWHDAPRLAPGLGDERPRPACGRLPIIRSSAAQPAGQAPGGLREATGPTQVRGGELTTGTRPSASFRASGDRLGSPSGRWGSRTATSTSGGRHGQRCVARALLAKYHVGPGGQGPGPASNKSGGLGDRGAQARLRHNSQVPGVALRAAINKRSVLSLTPGGESR